MNPDNFNKIFFTKDFLGYLLLFIAFLIFIVYFVVTPPQTQKGAASLTQEKKTMNENDKDLTPEQAAILEKGGTEAPFSSPLLKEKRKGTYYAADTKEPVFRSEDKYDSGTGWPSFTKPVTKEAVEEHVDESYGMTRTEVTTSAGGHLGHVFTDGPKESTGLRYCINGDALYFVPDEEQPAK